MEFRCRLGTATGEIIQGTYTADSEARLRRELEDKGLHVLSVRGHRGGWLPSLGQRRRRVAQQEFLIFNQELATLLKAGMPLVQSLDILRQRVLNPTFKTVLDAVHDRVKGGAALSDAFAEQGAVFPAAYAASLLAGERSGSLDPVIRRYVAYEKIVGAVRRRTVQALIYPAILMTMMVILVGVIVLFVVPAFAEFYADFDRELPFSTRVVVAISSGITANLAFIALGALGVVVAGLVWSRRPGQRERLDGLLLRLPWAGPTAGKFYTSRMARMLGTLLGGGIPLVNALEICVRSMPNQRMSRELDRVRVRVLEGQGFAAALRERHIVPDVAAKMVEVGESTGALQEMLNSLSDFYDEEIETEVGRFVTLIEPVLLVVMGVVIALVVLALYMPLFELSAVAGA